MLVWPHIDCIQYGLLLWRVVLLPYRVSLFEDHYYHRHMMRFLFSISSLEFYGLVLLLTISDFVIFCSFYLSRDTGQQYCRFWQQGSSTAWSCDTDAAFLAERFSEYRRTVLPWSSRYIEGTTIFRNVGKHSPKDTASHPRRLESSNVGLIQRRAVDIKLLNLN
jgi:hypothetical protein